MTSPVAINGTALSPAFVALLRQESEAPGAAPPRQEPRQAGGAEHDTGSDKKRARMPAIEGDTVIRLLTAAVVLAVASFAAVVSYSHIYDLARRHGQDGAAARLLPLSIDGLIAAASLVMLHASRNNLPVPRLARAMLATGVTATVAANVLFAIPSQWISPVMSALIGAAISAFPAVAFIGAVEMMIRFVRDARQAAIAAARRGGSGDSTSGVDDDSDRGKDDRDERQDDDRKDDKNPPPNRDKNPPAGRAKALAILKRNPALSDAVVARRAGVSERTVQRARETLKKENAGHA